MSASPWHCVVKHRFGAPSYSVPHLWVVRPGSPGRYVSLCGRQHATLAEIVRANSSGGECVSCLRKLMAQAQREVAQA